jgi:hypothetical protein
MNNLTHNQNTDAVDDLLTDMREHVSSLKNKLTSAGNVIGRSKNVNEKIAIMKEVFDFVKKYQRSCVVPRKDSFLKLMLANQRSNWSCGKLTTRK